METQNNQTPKGLKLYSMIVRSYAFPASIVPIIYGSLLAVFLNENVKFNFFLFILTLIGAICIHITTNVVNDIYDFRKGIDKKDEELGIPHGGSMVLSLNLATESQLKTITVISTLIAVGIGIFLYFETNFNPVILGLIIFGFFSAIYYTAFPISLKYKAIGDLQVFLSFGTGMTLGAYIVQTQEFSWIPVILSIPIGLLIAAILHSNNLRDIKFDSTFGVKTVAILIGEKLSKNYYYFLVFGAYASIIIFVIFKILPIPALINFITLPIAIKLAKMLKELPQENLPRFEYGTKHIILTSKLNMQFGLTLSIGILISILFHI
jgi:1,4-dihydroxy-2-naphthoate octaprenyltransferase